MAWSEETWSVGETEVQGKTVVCKFMNEFPDKDIRNKMSWLTVISWKYDGSTNNGMPPLEINKLMLKLESALEQIKGREKVYFDVYTQTGNNLKEFVFYISEREKFMLNFNDALKGHSVYPIEINFYEDSEWSDLEELQADFGITANKPLK